MRRVLLVLAAVVSVAAFAGPPGHANLTSGTVSVACSPGQCGSFYGVVEVAEAGTISPSTAARWRAQAPCANARVPARLGLR